MITILLATYNGATYLEEQLDSLFSQTVQNFKLIVQDDCSSDNTIDILQQYKARYSNRMEIVLKSTNFGAAKNFLSLMCSYKDDYVMLCDQDDVWLPRKVEHAYEEMKRIESFYGSNTPILVHTDLTVVDGNLNVIDRSFQQRVGMDSVDSMKQIVLRNNVTGCTVMYNHALAELLGEIPAFCVMHDWWLYLVAFCFGKVSYLPESHILYRQHSGNEIGARSVHGLGHKLYKLTHVRKISKALFDAYKQAEEFLVVYHNTLADEQKKVLQSYSSLQNKNKLGRLKIMFCEKLFRKGVLRMISQILFG